MDVKTVIFRKKNCYQL